jgi:hypothetical protein
VGKNTPNWSYWAPVSLKMGTKNQDKNSTQRKHKEKKKEQGTKIVFLPKLLNREVSPPVLDLPSLCLDW